MHTVKFYSAIQKNEIMTFVGKWMRLEIMLGKTSQPQDDKYEMFSLRGKL